MVSRAPRLRVSFALGSWQVVSLAAALRDAGPAAAGEVEDVLVLYETGPASEALQAAMREIAGVAWPWRRVVDAFELFAPVRRRLGQRAFDDACARLRALVGAGDVDALWLCWLSRPAEKLILETFPEARVFFYEDGLTSYLPLPRARTPGTSGPLAALRARLAARLDAWRPVRRLRRHKGRIDPRHAARVVAARMLLADLWPAPEALAHVPWHAVAPAALRETLADCRRIAAVAGFAAPAATRPAVLVVGQALSRFGALPRDAELAIYRDAVLQIAGLGYDVWWKEHPRAEQPFFAELAAAAPPGRLRELALPFALPVELVAGRLGLVACVAGISAVLYYLPRLEGIAAYTFADAFVPFLRERWALQNDMVRRSVAPLGALPALPTAAPAP